MGALVAQLLPLLFEKVRARMLKGKRAVIVVDDVARPLGPGLVEGHAKRLLELVESLSAAGAESVFAVATSSEEPPRCS